MGAAGIGVYEIGDWRFTPARNELARGADRRPLEFRAARVLEYLCAREGEIVSRPDLIAAVWQGRSLSDHSVAVVISALRKALDDDVKNPRYIETVAKRGYRLIPQDGAVAAPRDPLASGRFKFWALAAGALAAIVLIALAAQLAAPSRIVVTVNNIRNDTRDARYEAVAAAANEFSAEILARDERSILIRDFWDEDSWSASRSLFRSFGPKVRVFHLSGSIVLDGTKPFLALSLADGRDWSTVWTKTAAIKEGELAQTLEILLAGLPFAAKASSVTASKSAR